MDQIVTAALLIIGNEILSGRTKDANASFLAERLTARGIRLKEIRVVPDEPEEIVAAVNTLRGKYDYLFTTGGIGPTHDDITADCVAEAFGVPLREHPEAVRRLQAHYANPGMLNAARMRMTRVPEGGTLIDNPVSIAPGFRIGNVFVMAGVPKIMQAMFEGIAHTLTGGAPMLSLTVTSDLPEGTIAAALGVAQERFAAIEIGSYPFFRGGALGVSVVLRGTDAGALEAAALLVEELIRDLGGTPTRSQGPV